MSEKRVFKQINTKCAYRCGAHKIVIELSIATSEVVNIGGCIILSSACGG